MFIEQIKKSDFYKKNIESKKNLDSYFHKAFAKTLDSKFYLASYDPGMGKTQLVKDFIRKWKAAGFSPDGAIIIMVSRKEEIEDYKDKCGLDKEDFAIYAADKKLIRYGRGFSGAGNARVLFTTHEMVRRRTAEPVLSTL